MTVIHAPSPTLTTAGATIVLEGKAIFAGTFVWSWGADAYLLTVMIPGGTQVRHCECCVHAEHTEAYTKVHMHKVGVRMRRNEKCENRKFLMIRCNLFLIFRNVYVQKQILADL